MGFAARESSAFELSGDGVLGGGGVPADGEEVGFAADLAVFNILLAGAAGLVDGGFDPLEAAGALVAGGVHGWCSFGLVGGKCDVGRGVEAADFDEGGVEGGAAAEVGEALAGEGVDVAAGGGEFGPVEAGGDDAWGDGGADVGDELDRAAVVGDFDGVAGGDAAWGGVDGVHFEEVGGAALHLLMRGEVGEGGVHVVVGFAREELQGEARRGCGAAGFFGGGEDGDGEEVGAVVGVAEPVIGVLKGRDSPAALRGRVSSMWPSCSRRWRVMPRRAGASVVRARSMRSSSVSSKQGSEKAMRWARSAKRRVLGLDSPKGAMAGRLICAKR